MLQLVSRGAERGVRVIKKDDYYITHNYDGFDTLDFDISADDDIFAEITENAQIVAADNTYIITKIDGNGNILHVHAELDLSEWKTKIYENYDNGSKKLLEAIAQFIPSGWSFQNVALSSIYRTLRLDAGTALDLLLKCSNLYKVQFKIDAKSKTIIAINPESYTLQKAFVTEELNLRALNYYGDSSGLITRLEARGKDGLTFSDINNGKSYVDNNTYSSDIICGYWKDERYTDKASLLADTTAKLAELAVPARSYECDVVDLKSIDPDTYSAQDLSLYQKVSLKDIKRNIAYTYQVICVKEYPHYPENNVITLSTNPPKLSNRLDEIESTVEYIDEIKPNESEVNTAITNATSWITGGINGYVYFIRNDHGQPIEIVILDNENINLAQNVWRFNAGGLGHSSTGYNGPYTTAITQDGAIVADFITTGLLQGGEFTVAGQQGSLYKVTLDLDNGTFNIKDSNGNDVLDFDGSGNLSIKGDITGSTGTFSGSLSGADITVGGLNNTDGRVSVLNSSGTEVASLDNNGLTATTGSFSGSITATSGEVGGWDIGANTLSSGDIVLSSASNQRYIRFGELYVVSNVNSFAGLYAPQSSIDIQANNHTFFRNTIGQAVIDIDHSNGNLKIGTLSFYSVNGSYDLWDTLINNLQGQQLVDLKAILGIS